MTKEYYYTLSTILLLHYTWLRSKWYKQIRKFVYGSDKVGCLQIANGTIEKFSKCFLVICNNALMNIRKRNYSYGRLGFCLTTLLKL